MVQIMSCFVLSLRSMRAVLSTKLGLIITADIGHNAQTSSNYAADAAQTIQTALDRCSSDSTDIINLRCRRCADNADSIDQILRS